MDFNKLKKEALASGIKEIEVYQVKGDGALVSTFNTEVDDNSVPACSQAFFIFSFTAL